MSILAMAVSTYSSKLLYSPQNLPMSTFLDLLNFAHLSELGLIGYRLKIRGIFSIYHKLLSF